MSSDPLFLSPQSLVDSKKRISFTKILAELYKNGSTSIANLAKELHTSVPSITAMLADLIDNGWVMETGSAKTKSGRRPVFYDLNPNKKSILVIDVNLYETNFIFLNLRNKIDTKTTLKIKIADTKYLTEVCKEIDNLLKINKQTWAVGISAPGLIESKRGINFTHENLNQEGLSFGEVLNSRYSLPVYSINDTRASLLGEHHFGLVKEKMNALLVNLDWGVGLGILHNGVIVEGTDGFAGEIGHVQVTPNGKLCKCGKVGCLETVASASALIARAHEGINDGKATSLLKLKKEIELKDVINAALKGDEFSIDIIYDIGRELGKGLSTAVHLFNPEIIIVDGILKTAGDLIVSTLKQSIQKYCLAPFKQNLAVQVSPLSEEAKVFGTKSFVFQRMMDFYAS
ncbi:ROK family transcriptional regulator [Arcticibacterium luteifluviistationis]|uniref:Sugar kinase n=1 Tax=Arcticibacterium luteifluviistationis TaxID=1784714 RepID=A0A2Z4GGU7_9BACT|nr:ROK family transcriptional regulator [Arcticibacterium luteifluviistationis]AWW00511.1 sugar kinase [Arcticibacterium luteifluviistationis]